MAQLTDFYNQLAGNRAAELLDEYDNGFSEHPLSHQGITLSESQALNWLLLQAWWDCSTSERLIGNGLSRRQSETFEECLLNQVCERAGRGDVSIDNDDDERESNREFGLQLYSVVQDALKDAWNQGVEGGKSHGLATLVGLKAMGITHAETENFNDVFERTLQLLHERTIALARLLRPKETSEQRPTRKKMAPPEVHKWISDRPSDKEYRDSQENGTLPSDRWRVWAEMMPTKEEVAEARVEDDQLKLSALMDAIQKKTWVDTVDQVVEHGYPDEVYRASPEEKAAETRHRKFTPVEIRAIEKVVPGYSKAMKEIDEIEDDDLRAIARKRCSERVDEQIAQRGQRLIDEIEREKRGESSGGWSVGSLVTVGVIIVITLAVRSC